MILLLILSSIRDQGSGNLKLFIILSCITVIGRHNVGVRSYTDDTRLCTSCLTVDGPASTTQLLYCIDDISRWMALNRLKWMSTKQFIWLDSPRQLEAYSSADRWLYRIQQTTCMVLHAAVSTSFDLCQLMYYTLMYAFIADHIDYWNVVCTPVQTTFHMHSHLVTTSCCHMISHRCLTKQSHHTNIACLFQFQF